MYPPVPLQKYTAGPVFHGQDKNHIPPLESRVDLPREDEECDPQVAGTHLVALLLEKGEPHTFLPLPNVTYAHTNTSGVPQASHNL